MRQSPRNDIVCRCTPQSWQLAQETAAAIECTDATQIQFEDWPGRSSPWYGPFSRLQFQHWQCLADGELFVELLYATLQWRHYESGIAWRILKIVPAR